MKYHIESQDSFIELHIDADTLITADHLDELDENQFLDDFQKAIEENSDIDYLHDYVSDTHSDLTPIAQGSFDLDVVDRTVFQKATDNLQAFKEKANLTITEYDGCGKIIATKEISFFPILQKVLTRHYEDSGWDGCVSFYIENCLMAFEEQGRWHYGLQTPCGSIEENVSEWPAPHTDNGHCRWITDGVELQPIIWFGLDNQAPDPKWILWNYTHSIDDIWFSDSDWDAMENLIENVNNGFLIWYTAEVACFGPDMKSVLSECSVDVNSEDSVQEITDKIETFFLSKWKQQH